MAVLFVFLQPIGELLGTTGMAVYVGWYAVAQLIDRARYIPKRLLVRDLRFKRSAQINALGEAVFVTVALALAAPSGPYAIVVATVSRAVVTAILFVKAVPQSEWLVPTPLREDAPAWCPSSRRSLPELSSTSCVPSSSLGNRRSRSCGSPGE